MGIYSTMYITREDAINEIKENLDRAPDECIAEALFGLVGTKTFDNFMIVDKYEEFDDEGWYNPNYEGPLHPFYDDE